MLALRSRKMYMMGRRRSVCSGVNAIPKYAPPISLPACKCDDTTAVNIAGGMMGQLPSYRPVHWDSKNSSSVSLRRDGYHHQPLWSLMGKRMSHHSAERGKYYTNRFYMKKCSMCSAWNNLAVTQCAQCFSALGADSIRLRTVDPLCQTANCRRSDMESFEYIVLFRCFDFAVILHPQPASSVHISAVPNGTFYDIKNLRKNHVPMLNKMKARCEAILRGIITGTQVPEFLRNEHVDRLQQQVKLDSGDTNGAIVTDMVSHAIYGFNYPSSFSHVEMHAVLPPIRSFNIFKSPFFYPLSKILSDLEHLSQVKSYTPDEAKQLYEEDIILDDIVDIDRTFREKYNF